MSRFMTGLVVKAFAVAYALATLVDFVLAADDSVIRTRTENWMQWRGPTADGLAGSQANPPIQRDKTTNVSWSVDLLGEGSATPIVFGNQIFVLSAVKTNRKSPKPVVNDERAKTTPDEFFYQFVVSSYDRNSGKTLWQRTVVEDVPHEGKHETHTYAAGSPITDGERLYFSFGSRGVFCYSLEGEPIWNLDLGDMRTRNGWGEAVTPVLVDDLVIINWDQEEGSFITAIEKRSGQIRWKKDRQGEVTSWNTPFVTSFEGKVQKDNESLDIVAVNSLDDVIDASPVAVDDQLFLRSWKKLYCIENVQAPEQNGTSHKSRDSSSSPLSFQNVNLEHTSETSANASVADMNGDGYLDLIVANRKSSSYVILNDGKGAFLREKWIVVPSESATTIVAADFNRDEFIDLAIPHRDGGESRVLFNDDKLSFQKGTTFGPAAASTRACAAGDLNGDGVMDLIAGDDRRGTYLYINDGQGKFTTAIAIGDAKLAAYAIATGLVNGDDHVDVIIGYASGESRVFLNSGTGVKFQEVMSGDETGAIYGLALGDLNGDDSLDIVKARSEAPNAVVLCSESKSKPIEREIRNVSGWQVHISRKLLETEADDTAKALDGLKKMLDEIVRDLPAAAVTEMKKVPLYFSPSYKEGQSGAEFHPGAGWLRDNGRDPEMAQGVEFSGVHDFEAEMLRMPNFALHELAHAYHFRTLPDGFGNEEIKAAFKRAKENGLYERVERTFGNGNPSAFERAYAMTNAMEYFAETSEAYFFRNDFFPFTREELRRHDPEMYALLEKLWGVQVGVTGRK